MGNITALRRLHADPLEAARHRRPDPARAHGQVIHPDAHVPVAVRGRRAALAELHPLEL